MNLLERSTPDDFLSHPDLLTDLIRVIEDREMPPEDEPPLSASEHEGLLSGKRSLLAESLQKHADPPRTPVRRPADQNLTIREKLIAHMQRAD